MPDKTEEIISEIEKNPILYDKSLKGYKDVDKKKDVWKAIAKRVGLTGWYLTNFFLLGSIVTSYLLIVTWQIRAQQF